MILAQDWSVSSASFLSSADCSIIGYDYDQEKVIILGGSKKESSDSERKYKTDQNTLYIYNIIEDKLSSIYIAWDRFLVLLNCGTTNAIITDSIMYFATQSDLLKLDLNPFYIFVDSNNNKSQSSLPLTQPEILPINTRYVYGYYGCIVIDDSKSYLIISDIQNESYIYNKDALTYDHAGGACLIMDNILYIIGGVSNVTEYIDIQNLNEWSEIPKSQQYKDQFPYQWGYKLQQDTSYSIVQSVIYAADGIAVIKDEENKLIYVLGGAATEGSTDHSTEIYRLNVIDQSMELLNISLPYPGFSHCTTVFSKIWGRIYAFRGNGEWPFDKILVSNSVFAPTPKPTQPQNPPNSANTNNTMLSTTMELVLGIIVIGLICIFCTVMIGMYAIKRILNNKEVNSSPAVEENLITEKSEINYQDIQQMMDEDKADQESVELCEIENVMNFKSTIEENEDNDFSSNEEDGKSEIELDEIKSEEIENTNNESEHFVASSESKKLSMEMLSDRKQNELYEIYLKSKFVCFNKCEEIGISEKYMKELFNRFEQNKKGK